MSFTYEGDYFNEALRLLPWQFKDDPRIVALLKGLAAGIQALEDDMQDLYTSRRIGGASGKFLDTWGALIAEPRLGADDFDYRRAILAKHKALRSSGSREDIVAMASALLGPTAEVQFFDAYPAAYRLVVARLTPLTASERARLDRYLELATAAGVKFRAFDSSGLDLFTFDLAGAGFDAGLLP